MDIEQKKALTHPGKVKASAQSIVCSGSFLAN